MYYYCYFGLLEKKKGKKNTHAYLDHHSIIILLYSSGTSAVGPGERRTAVYRTGPRIAHKYNRIIFFFRKIQDLCCMWEVGMFGYRKEFNIYICTYTRRSIVANGKRDSRQTLCFLTPRFVRMHEHFRKTEKNSIRTATNFQWPSIARKLSECFQDFTTSINMSNISENQMCIVQR